METTARTAQDDKVDLETSKEKMTEEDGREEQSSSKHGGQETLTDKMDNEEQTDSRNSTKRSRNKKPKEATDALNDQPVELTEDPDDNPHRETNQGTAKKSRPRSSKGKRKNAMQFDSQKPSSTPASKTQDSTPKKGPGGSSRDKKKGSQTPRSASHNKKTHPHESGVDVTPTKGEPKGQSTPRSESKGKGRGTSKSQSNYSGTPNRNRHFKPFEDYLSLEEVSDGLKRKQLLQGAIRINPRNFEESYLDSQDGGSDIFINGINARNRAMEGDVVIVQLLHKSTWRLMEDAYKRYKQMAQKELKTKSSSEPKTEETVLEEQLQDLELAGLHDKSAMNPVEGEAAEVTKDKQRDVSVKHDQADCLVFEKVPESNGHKVESQASNGLDTKSQDEGDSLQEEMDSIVKKLFPEEERVNEEEEIPEKFYQKLAKVVYIVEKRHSRACSGHLKPQASKNASDALFSPTDYRVPRIYIPVSECPEGFLERPGDFETVLFIARIEEWPKNSLFARGHLHRSLGEAGEIEPETEGMLIEHGVDYSDFSDEVLACLPKNLPWTIPEVEIARRRSFRDECVFTIDPATARDLDDALSCEALGDGVYEVGVHIADVSFFVEENNALDKVAGLRATSVYLVQKVIPMLPRLLCEHLCSLNPNEDKLTFSFLWRLTEKGEILEEWCGRSVIRSCVKMSYEHAQGIISEPERVWTKEEMPTITNGFIIPDIAERVLNLNKIAQNLRKKRSDDGALRLDQVKLQFTLDKESGLPSGYNVYQQRESNKLVEEFMLLANMAAAHRIYNANRDTALLRRHPPPKTKMMDDLDALCSEIGLKVDCSSSKSIQESLNRYLGPLEDKASWGRGQILTVKFSKPMQRAKYFCTGTIEVEDHYRHYALNVPFYTHFTSPIRRYADIIVHRQLAASLGVGPPSLRDEVTIQDQAVRCNERKDAAKTVSDMSREMFFAIFVRECGPLKEDAMVMQVLDRALDVLVMNLGVVKRVYCNEMPLKSFNFVKQGKQGLMTIVWGSHDHEDETQILQLFSVVKVELKAGKDPLKFVARMLGPE